MKAAKFWVALVGGVAASVITFVDPDTTIGKVLAGIVALCTAAGVYIVKNAPDEPGEG